MAGISKGPLVSPLERKRLRFMTCGSVDDGKSTLIGRLLLESGAVFEDHLVEASRASGGELDLAYLVDGLKAEREQGITIDVAYRYFMTPRRAFLIADAPGHEQYTRNHAAAASQTQLAIVLVSADEGVKPQTRRHMAIASLFGVKDMVVAINKMDRVGREREPFAAIAAELKALAKALGLTIRAMIPISAKEGDNVVKHSAGMPWYEGSTLLDVLETFEPDASGSNTTLLPIAWTGRVESGGRVSFGELACGELKVGQNVRTETGLSARVERLWTAGEPAPRASAGDAVAVELSPELDLGRGAVLTAEDNGLQVATKVRARLIWLVPEAPRSGRTYDIHVGTGQAAVSIGQVEGRLGMDDLSVSPSDLPLQQNEIVVVGLSLASGVACAPFQETPGIGAFIIIDRISRQTVAAGVVLSVERRIDDTPWQATFVTAEDRARSLGQSPVVIWFTGLSGSGKSTLADRLDRQLHAAGRHIFVLDGDNLRNGLSQDLGFSNADRSENIRRTAHAAALMADAGLIVVASLISPFRQDRAAAREIIGAQRFIEVFIDAPLDVCQARDPKGMYARVKRGDIRSFTGVSASYEPPLTPDIHVRTNELDVDDAAEFLLDAIRKARRW